MSITIEADIQLSGIVHIARSVTIRNLPDSHVHISCAPGVATSFDVSGAAGSVVLAGLSFVNCSGTSGSVIQTVGVPLSMTDVTISGATADAVLDVLGNPASSFNITACNFSSNSVRLAVVRVRSTTPGGIPLPNNTLSVPNASIAAGASLISTYESLADPTAAVGLDWTGKMVQLRMSDTNITGNTVASTVLDLDSTLATAESCNISGNVAQQKPPAAGANGSTLSAPDVVRYSKGGLDMSGCSITDNTVPGNIFNISFGLAPLSLRGCAVSGNNAASVFYVAGYTWFLDHDAFAAAKMWVEYTYWIYDLYPACPTQQCWWERQYNRTAHDVVEQQTKADTYILLQQTSVTGNTATVGTFMLIGTGQDIDNYSRISNITEAVILMQWIDADVSDNIVLPAPAQPNGSPGGLLYTLKVRHRLVSSVVRRNIAPSLVIVIEGSLNITGMDFSDNIIGGLMLNASFSKMYFTGPSNSFNGNHISGSPMLQIVGTEAWLNDTSFDGNVAAGWPLVLVQDAVPFGMDRLTFTHNVADRMLSLEACSVLFCNNGGVQLVTTSSLSFVNNSGTGLALYRLKRIAGNSPLPALIDAVFHNNVLPTADSSALYLDSTFTSTNDTVTYSLGAASITVINGSFINNTAPPGVNALGGAIRAPPQGVATMGLELNIYSSQFLGNAGGQGGALYSAANTTVLNCTFDGNTASQAGGAALIIAPTTNLTNFTSCIFTGNAASATLAGDPTFPSGSGGAVAVDAEIGSAVFADCSFVGNKGNLGGALYAHARNASGCTNCNVTMLNSVARGNSVHNGGGSTIAWAHQDITRICCSGNAACFTALMAQQCPDWSDNVVVGNQTYDKNGYATVPASVVVDYGASYCDTPPVQFIPQGTATIRSGSTCYLKMSFVDHYGMNVTGYGDGIVVTLQGDDNLLVIGVKNDTAFSRSVAEGYRQFVQLVGIQVQPAYQSANNRTYTIRLSATDPDTEAPVISFRLPPCTLGQHQDTFRCLVCSNFSYSLNATIDCDACPEGGDCNGGVLLPMDGYWQTSPLLPQILPCPLDYACQTASRSVRLSTLQRLLPNPDQLLNASAVLMFNDSAWGMATAADGDAPAAASRRLLTALNSTNATAAITYAEALEVYATAMQAQQCSDGYEGLACGACQSGYGRYARRCVECFPRAVNGLVFVLMLVFMGSFVGLAVALHLKSRGQYVSDDPDAGAIAAMTELLPAPLKRLASLNKTPSLGVSPIASRMQSRFSAEADNKRISAPPTRGVSPSPLSFTAMGGLPSRDPSDTSLRCDVVLQRGEPPSKSGKDSPAPAEPPAEAPWRSGLAELASMLKVVATFMQVTAMARSISVDWPSSLATFYRYFDVSSTTQWASPECSMTGDAEQRAVMTTIVTVLLPVVFAAASLPIWLGVWLYQRRCNPDIAALGIHKYLRPRIVVTLLEITYYLYPLVTSTLLNIFSCTTIDQPAAFSTAAGYRDAASELRQLSGGGEVGVGSGTWISGRFWTRNYNTVCYTSQHLKLALGLGVPGFLVFALGVPLTYAGVLAVHRHRLEEQEVRLQFGFLFQEYTSDCFFWESVIMARKALLLLVTTSLGGTAAGSYIQLYTGVLLLLTFMILQEMVRPLRSGTLNHMERTSLWSSCVTFGLLSFLLMDSTQFGDSSRLAIAGVILTVNIITLAYFMIEILSLGRRTWQDLLRDEGTRRVLERARSFAVDNWATCWGFFRGGGSRRRRLSLPADLQGL